MTYMLFILCLIQVESSNNNFAIGDNGKAVGCLQIHPIMVKEVNRILVLNKSKQQFILADRTSRKKSIQMATIYFQHHGNNINDYDTMARSWNAGPSWKKNKKTTDKYWAKVTKKMHNAIYYR